MMTLLAIFTFLVSIQAIRLNSNLNAQNDKVTEKLWDSFWSREGVIVHMFECFRDAELKSDDLNYCFDMAMKHPVASVLRYDIPVVTYQHARQFGLIFKNSVKQLQSTIRDSECREKCKLKKCDESLTSYEWADDVSHDLLKHLKRQADENPKRPLTQETNSTQERSKELIGGPGELRNSICTWSSFENMMDRQHAVLELVAEHWKPEMEHFYYHGLHGFYNQVEFIASPQDIAAVFYTHHSDPGFLRKNQQATKSNMGGRAVSTDFQGQRAHRAAIDLATLIKTAYNIEVPVIQFNHGDEESWSPPIALDRVHSNKNKDNTKNIFQSAAELVDETKESQN